MSTLAQRFPSEGPIGELLTRREAPPLISLVLLFVCASLTTTGFLTFSNIEGVLEQIAVIAIVAVALNQVILAGEIDISVGSLLAVCAYAFGTVSLASHSLFLALLAAIVVGGLVGVVNGALSTYGKIPSIITTLGSLFVLRGGILLIAGSQVINIDDHFRFFGIGTLGPLPASILLLGLVYAAYETLSRHSRWGRNLVAVGGNPRAAQDIGLPVHRTRFLCFVATGLTCGLASAIYFGQIGQLQATAATGFELRVITAVVLGGTSIMGGAGSNLAPLIGAFLVGTILNVMTLNRVPATFELLSLGSLILFAVLIEGMRTRVAERQ